MQKMTYLTGVYRLGYVVLLHYLLIAHGYFLSWSVNCFPFFFK